MLGLNGYRPIGTDDIGFSLGGVYYGSSVECKVSDIDGTSLLSKGIILVYNGPINFLSRSTNAFFSLYSS